MARADSGSGLTIFEIEGDRKDPGVYGNAGRIVLNQSDLLIAVWDGGKAAGPGGTVETMREALDYHVPVIWIDARRARRLASAAWAEESVRQAWQRPRQRPTLRQAGIRHRARRTQHPGYRTERAMRTSASPNPVARPGGKIMARHSGQTHQWRGGLFFRDKAPDQSGFRLESVPRYHDRLACCTRWTLFPKDFEQQAKARVAGDERHRRGAIACVGLDQQPVAPPLRLGRPPGRLLCRCPSQRLCAGLSADGGRAVFIALLPMALAHTLGKHASAFELACDLAEFSFLSFVAWLLWWGRRQRWHDRWTEYRLLAELIRQLRFLVPLGGGKPLPRTMPDHMAVYGDPARTWMYWHVRAIAREIGIPGARVGQGYLHDCLAFLAQTVGNEKSGQWGFHLVTERRSHRLSDNLHVAVLILLGLTLAGVAYRLWLHHPGPAGRGAPNWLVLLAASLPALGSAALEGIANPGRIHSRRRQTLHGDGGPFPENMPSGSPPWMPSRRYNWRSWCGCQAGSPRPWWTKWWTGAP